MKQLQAINAVILASAPWKPSSKISKLLQVPVLQYNGKKIGESLDISRFLDQEFPEPSVFKTKCNIGKVLALKSCTCFMPYRESFATSLF